MQLRDYQLEVVELLKTPGNKLIQAPTGAGKTIIFSKFIQECGQKCLVLAHRGELIRQAADKLSMATGLKCGVFSAYMKRKEIGNITVASIQSLANYKGELDFDNIIIDECHHLSAVSFERVLKKCKAKFVLGLTATLKRKDGHHPG